MSIRLHLAIASLIVFALNICAETSYPSVIYSADGKELGYYRYYYSRYKKSSDMGLAPYFCKELSRMLMARKPYRSDYPSWNYQAFKDDSIAWATNPLYGWIQKNPKKDGTYYNLYDDGLKIYTTIDSRMQQYAEDAVTDHLSETLQPAFFREKKGAKTAPYSSNPDEISAKGIEQLVNRAIRGSERYRVMKLAGRSTHEIDRAFNTPTKMKAFSYAGWIDTVMTPRDSILYTKHFLRVGFLSLDPRNGYVKAYVGGPDFKAFPFDMVSTGRHKVGSLIQPFLYTYAMEEGFTPDDKFLNDQPIIYDAVGHEWQPRNNGSSRIGEMVDLRWAFVNSSNWIAARLIDELSSQTLANNLNFFGVNNHLDATPSLALGICDVSVKEMATAYSAFANDGIRVDPMFVTHITDSNDNIISYFVNQSIEVISNHAYDKMKILFLENAKSSRTSGLSGSSLNAISLEGAYSGSTFNNSDGWFAGYTTDLLTIVWVGGEEQPIHFNSWGNYYSATMAIPIFDSFMKHVQLLPKRRLKQSIIPEVIGKPLRQVKKMLQSLGFNNITVEYIPSDYKELVFSLESNSIPIIAGTMHDTSKPLVLKVGQGRCR